MQFRLHRKHQNTKNSSIHSTVTTDTSHTTPETRDDHGPAGTLRAPSHLRLWKWHPKSKKDVDADTASRDQASTASSASASTAALTSGNTRHPTMSARVDTSTEEGTVVRSAPGDNIWEDKYGIPGTAIISNWHKLVTRGLLQLLNDQRSASGTAITASLIEPGKGNAGSTGDAAAKGTYEISQKAMDLRDSYVETMKNLTVSQKTLNSWEKGDVAEKPMTEHHAMELAVATGYLRTTSTYYLDSIQSEQSSTTPPASVKAEIGRWRSDTKSREDAKLPEKRQDTLEEILHCERFEYLRTYVPYEVSQVALWVKLSGEKLSFGDAMTYLETAHSKLVKPSLKRRSTPPPSERYIYGHPPSGSTGGGSGSGVVSGSGTGAGTGSNEEQERWSKLEAAMTALDLANGVVGLAGGIQDLAGGGV